MYKLLLILIILFSSKLFSASNTPTSKEDKYLNTASDTLVILPNPVAGIEKGAIRLGFQFSVMKILIPDKKIIRPYLELGISVFNHIDKSPNDKKHLFLQTGLILPISKIALLVNTGLVYGNKKIFPGLGLSVWRFLYKKEKLIKKTSKDFKTYTAYLAWKNKKRKSSLIKASALSFNIQYNFNIEPAIVIGLAFNIFL
ncbi:MAG: hypothetical protein KAQ92_04550 [Candidatus Aenigmarchaeota archaeon]|nr:hypothetical protein [Candidatus Aenigmarchaeota archaeon]